MSEFEKRLSKAIERGSKRSIERQQAAQAAAMGQAELKKLHTQFRLQLSDRIEECMKQLPIHFPGFQFETIYGEKGWGAGCSRDDVGAGEGGRRTNFYSRLEMTIRPYSDMNVVDLAAKGTIRNKEVMRQNHFEVIQDADMESFENLIDVWVLDYAELFSAKSE